MARARAARVLILCTLVVGVVQARAETPPVRRSPVRLIDGQIRFVRRAVAVVELSDDPGVRDVATRLLEVLAAHTELAPPAVSDGAALVDERPAEDEARIAEARRKHAAALTQLGRRNFREAAQSAIEGQEQLLRVSPAAAIGLYAELALAVPARLVDVVVAVTGGCRHLGLFTPDETQLLAIERCEDGRAHFERVEPGSAYVLHPTSDSLYLPMETFHPRLFQEKAQELLRLLQSLGAKEVYVEHEFGLGDGMSFGFNGPIPTKAGKVMADVKARGAHMQRGHVVQHERFA